MVNPWYSLSLVHLCSSSISDWVPPDEWIIHTRRPKLSETQFLSSQCECIDFPALRQHPQRLKRGCSLVSGEEGWKNSNAENCKITAHLWILHQRAQMKGRDCNAAASTTVRKLHTGSEAVSDDDMVSSLLWSTARPDADTWPTRSGALFNHLKLKRCTFDKERQQDAQTISVLHSKPDLICHKRSPRRNYYMQHLLQSWEHISKQKINRALLICKVLVKKTKCSFKQKHSGSVSCHCMVFMRESVWHIRNARQ